MTVSPSSKSRFAATLVRTWLASQPARPLLVVLGPTASGKTALAIKLARQYDGEIVSADSRAVYRECDLGTAKPTARELAATVHHCVSVYSPSRVVSVVAYRRKAEAAIREILRRGRLPILTGSHTLLISAIVENYQFPSRGQRTAGSREPTKGRRKYATLLLGLRPPREQLYARIDTRVDQMLKKGLLDEVSQLSAKYDRYTPALRGHGYRELLDYLNGEKPLAQAITEIKQDTRNYAKRQMTWFRNCDYAEEIVWLD